jgi:hypothetical protein
MWPDTERKMREGRNSIYQKEREAGTKTMKPVKF